MTINFYTMCNILFDLDVRKFNFPTDSSFNAVSSRGIRIYDLELIKTFYENEKKYINIYLQDEYFPNVFFEDEENIKYFKKSTIEVNKEQLFLLLFGGECVNV